METVPLGQAVQGGFTKEEGKGQVRHAAFGVVEIEEDSEAYIGAEKHSNNTGELTGLHSAILRARTRPRGGGAEEICSDSLYAINMTTGKWMPRKAQNQRIVSVLRKEWRQLGKQRPGEVRMRHVRSHVKVPGNEAADWLAARGVVDTQTNSQTNSQTNPQDREAKTTKETTRWIKKWVATQTAAATAHSRSNAPRGSRHNSPNSSPHALSKVAEPRGIG